MNRFHTHRFVAAAAVTVLLAGTSHVRAQAPAAPTESALIAQGYALLDKGDAAKASAIAAQALGASPRSSAALSLAVDAAARSGSMNALNTYERWLGTRQLDEAYVLRRVATVVLREALLDKQTPHAHEDALTALASDGDVDALNELARLSSAGTFADTEALASLSDDRAVKALIDQLTSQPGNKANVINALSNTKSKLAIPPLMGLLNDKNPDTRARAADALGKIGATDALPALQKLFAEAGYQLSAEVRRAGALARLEDANGIVFLQQEMGARSADPQMALVWAEAAEALVTHPDPTWLSSVRALAQTSDPQARIIAARLLAPYDNAAARAALDGLANDENISVRNLAAGVMAGTVANDFVTLRQFLRQGGTLTRVKAAGRILELTR